MSAADDEALIRRYHELFNTRDLHRAASLVASGCEFQHLPTKERTRGPRGYLVLAEQWVHAFPDLHTTVEHIEPAGPGAYRVTLRLRGTRTRALEVGPLARIGGDGQPFDLMAMQDVRIEDGLIAAVRLSYDRAALAADQRQAGDANQ